MAKNQKKTVNLHRNSTMEEKKTAKANLEFGRTTFLLLGFVAALSTLFVALEWESNESLSPYWSGFSPLFIEQESMGVQGTPIETETVKPTEVTSIQPAIISDEFNVVEEVSAEEIVPEREEPETENVPLPDSIAGENIVYAEAEIMPQFKGGYIELVRFIYNNMKYPSEALKQRIQGKVWCSFIIGNDGSISNIQLEQGLNSFLDEEALRVLRIMPSWDPGIIGGRPVKVKIYLPIVFKL